MTRPGLVRSTWSVFLAAALLGLGHGLQGTLLGIRGSQEGFGPGLIGLIMTGYYLGFIGGSRFTVRALGRVGHIRAFAALASTASSAALAYALVVHPVMWLVMRILTGFCMAGLYVVLESWLNDRADNEHRGRTLSVYMIVTMGAVAVAQLVLAAGEVGNTSLFMIASVLVSMSLVPMALSENRAPEIRVPDALSVGALWRLVPTGLVASFLTGVSVGALRGLAPTFGAESGWSTGLVALFVGAITIGASACQYPIGSISDRLPRRGVMLVVAVVGVAVSAAAAARDLSGTAAPLLAFALGGAVVPMYSLTIAYTNDWLGDAERVAAAAQLIVVNGAGAVFGPILGGAVMQATSPGGLFVMIAATQACTAGYLGYRVLRARAPAVSDQTPFVPLSNRGAGLVVLRALRQRRRGESDTD